MQTQTQLIGFLTSTSTQPLVFLPVEEKPSRSFKGHGRPSTRITQQELNEIMGGICSSDPAKRKAVYNRYPKWMQRTAVAIAKLDMGKQGMAYKKSSCPTHGRQSLSFRYNNIEGIRVHCELCPWTSHFEPDIWAPIPKASYSNRDSVNFEDFSDV